MSDNRKLPATIRPGSLPSLGIPANPPKLSTALVVHLRNRVADVMYGRMNSIADKRVKLEEQANSLIDLATQRERLLGVWDDLDNILGEDQKARDGDRAANDFHRGKAAIDHEYDLQTARVNAQNRLAVAQAEQRRLQQHEPTVPKPTPGQNPDTAQHSPALLKVLALKKMYHDLAEARHMCETDPSISPHELADAIAYAELIIRDDFQKKHGSGGSPADDQHFHKTGR